MGSFEGEVRFRSDDFVLEETKGGFVLSTVNETRSTRMFFSGVKDFTDTDFELRLDGKPVGTVSKGVPELLVFRTVFEGGKM